MTSSAMEQDTLSTYNSIIPEDVPQWIRILNSESFAQLHAKFWGADLQEEETRWRKTQSEDGPMNVDVDNETAEEDEEDETGPGCYILRLPWTAGTTKTIWIRQEYIRVYDFCETYQNFCRTNLLHAPPSVVVTGQPGIGKSYWALYALCRCLAKKKPVMWYSESRLYLFVEEGVYESPERVLHTVFKTLVWTLIDSDQAKEGVPPAFAEHGTAHFNIYTTSLDMSRWYRLHKTTQSAVCVMNPWSKTEILKAAVIYGLENDQHVFEFYDEYGPTPRICFDYLRNKQSLKNHQMRYKKALAKLSIEELRNMVLDATTLTMDDMSHTLLLVKRMSKELEVDTTLDIPSDEDLVLAKVEFVSHVVEMALQVRLWEQLGADQLTIYRQFANVQAMRCIAGLAFESLVHKKLGKRIVLGLIPMVLRELLEPGEGKKKPRWHSNHGDEDPLSVRPIDITPLRTTDYEGSRPDQIEDKVYYVPKSKNRVAFDSFIMADGNLYIFQCSIASIHPIKAGIVPFSPSYPLPPQDHWYFVFVVPKEPEEPTQEIKCPQPRDRDRDSQASLAPDKMKLYTALLDIAQP